MTKLVRDENLKLADQSIMELIKQSCGGRSLVLLGSAFRYDVKAECLTIFADTRRSRDPDFYLRDKRCIVAALGRKNCFCPATPPKKEDGHYREKLQTDHVYLESMLELSEYCCQTYNTPEMVDSRK